MIDATVNCVYEQLLEEEVPKPPVAWSAVLNRQICCWKRLGICVNRSVELYTGAQPDQSIKRPNHDRITRTVRMKLARWVLGILGFLSVTSGRAEDVQSTVSLSAPQECYGKEEIVISVADQRLALIEDGAVTGVYPISTSKFGLGDSWGSYKTPLGRLRIWEKIGDRLPLGAVLKNRSATGEVLAVNAPGRDPIVTRILWLDGLEPGNAQARERAIYIHGTPEEIRLGEPVSWGCIRMRSRDVVTLFDQTSVGCEVLISAEPLAKLLPKFVSPVPKNTAKDQGMLVTIPISSRHPFLQVGMQQTLSLRKSSAPRHWFKLMIGSSPAPLAANFTDLRYTAALDLAMQAAGGGGPMSLVGTFSPRMAGVNPDTSQAPGSASIVR